MIDEAWQRYLEWAKDAKSSWKDDEMRWESHVKSHIAGKKMDVITAFDVQKIIDSEVEDILRRVVEEYVPS